MPRPRPNPSTALGAAIQARRGVRSQAAVSEETSVAGPTLSRIERGTHAPSLDTAMALAKWLGWSVEQVVEAARTPAGEP